MESIKEFLASIGFGKNETEIYSALVELGTSSVLSISKHTKIHRSNIYDALRSLVQKGLVYEINEATKLFAARPPESLTHYLKIREAELGEIIKDYEKKFSHKGVDAKVKVSKGPFALREAILSLLEIATKSIDAYGIPETAPETIGPILKEFHQQRIKKGILMRHIYNSTAIERVKVLNKMKLTEGKVLPAKYDSHASTILSNDRIIMILWDQNLTVIEIEDESLARPYETYFDILWSKAKVPK